MNIEQISSHIKTVIDATPVQPKPAPYIFVENFFPEDIYSQILKAYSSSSPSFKKGTHTGDPKIFFGSYGDRYELKIPNDTADLTPELGEFWTNIKKIFDTSNFFESIKAKFNDGFQTRFINDDNYKNNLNSTLLLTKHKQDYFLGPHTDRFEKVITCVFYVVEPEQEKNLEHLGTAMYEPKEKGFTCTGIVHHNPDKFIHTHTVPFRRNSALIFFRDDRLFHGVEKLSAENLKQSDRMNIQYNVWYKPPKVKKK